MTKRSLILDRFLPYRLSIASNLVSQVIARSYMEATGLKTNEWRLICVLAEEGGLSQQGLVGRTQMDKVSVSRAATGLSARGLVRRVPDPADARSLLLSLTPEGKRIYAEFAPEALALEEALLRELPAEEIERLEGLLRALEARANTILGER